MADFLRVVLPPIPHSRAYRHKARIGAFVILNLVVGGAFFAQFVGETFGEGRRQLLLVVAGANSIPKPSCPAIDAFAEQIEMR